MPACETKFHGTVEYEPEQLLDVPDGLFGFPSERQLLLLEVPSLRPLVFIQSIHSAELCFLGLPVQVIEASYRLRLSDADIRELGYTPEAAPQMGRDLLCLALLSSGQQQTTPQKTAQTTANLQAPLVIDIARHRGKQVILGEEYSPQHPFLSPMLGQAC